MRIYLTGFMGSGKSYIGRRLAANLNLPFFDLDTEIEAGEGRVISTIFAEDGEAFFREKERFYLEKLTKKHANFILATGGGTPCFFENAAYLKANGLVLFLETAPSLLVQRLRKETAHRPLLAKKNDAQLLDFVQVMLGKRRTFYEQAHMVYEQKTGNEPTVEELTRYLKRFQKITQTNLPN